MERLVEKKGSCPHSVFSSVLAKSLAAGRNQDSYDGAGSGWHFQFSVGLA